MSNSALPNQAEDPFDLNRFVQAQRGVYEQALAELKRGCKETHWMWFVFPQLEGLGRSPTAQFYAIKSVNEAKAYLAHPLLGPRLLECTQAILQVSGNSAAEIFDYPDDLKLHSSLTLFASVAGPDSVFARALGQYFQGQPDSNTVELLQPDR